MEGSMQPMQPAQPAQPPKSNMPLIAMIMSIVGIFCCGLLAIAGLILGYIEMGKIDRGEASAEGRGMAKAAVIIGLVAIGLWVIGLIISIATGGFTFYIGS